MRLPPGFVYNRPVPRRWAEDLATLAPQSDLRPWLLLAWLSGDPWEPVQRWCVYEMVPLRVWWGIVQQHRAQGKPDDEIFELYILEALNGPNPRTLGHYDTVLQRFVTEAECTRQEWELHREHKAVPLLFWVIQGTNGGHKRHFTPLEQKYAKLAGLPDEPPAPGDLPYADFDQRVLDQLARRERLHQLGSTLSGFVESETDPHFVEFRRRLVGYIEEQVRTDLESTKLNISGIRRSSAKEDDPSGHIEQAIDSFIQTGSTDPPPE